MQNVLRGNLAEIKRRIERAAQRSGRNADEIKLIAVSKTHRIEVLQAAIAAVFGENKVQENFIAISKTHPQLLIINRI